MDTEVFDAHVGHILRPPTRRGDVLVLDNLSAHHASRIEEVAGSAGRESSGWCRTRRPSRR